MVTANVYVESNNKKIAYPQKPVQLIVAFTPGGSTDQQARIMQRYWNKYVSQPLVFKYITGKGGSKGFEEIAKADKDGYTIGGVNLPHIVLQPIGLHATYKPEQFDYICQVVADPQVVAVRKESELSSVNNIVEYARRNPGELKVGVVGTYTGTYITFLDLQKKMNVNLHPIVYKGSANQIAALLGREVDLIIGNFSDVVSYKEEIRVLGITTPERYNLLPDVPTLKELGFNVVSDIRRGFVTPRGIPKEHLAALRSIFKKISQDPEYISDMKINGQPNNYMDGSDFEKYTFELNKKANLIIEKYDNDPHE